MATEELSGDLHQKVRNLMEEDGVKEVDLLKWAKGVKLGTEGETRALDSMNGWALEKIKRSWGSIKHLVRSSE